jgi:hypothetical protein
VKRAAFNERDLAVFDALAAVTASTHGVMATRGDLQHEMRSELSAQRLVGMQRRGLLFRDEIAEDGDGIVWGWMATEDGLVLAAEFRAARLRCEVCDDDGWCETWDEDAMRIVATYECPRLSEPGHAPFNATDLLSAGEETR